MIIVNDSKKKHVSKVTWEVSANNLNAQPDTVCGDKKVIPVVDWNSGHRISTPALPGFIKTLVLQLLESQENRKCEIDIHMDASWVLAWSASEFKLMYRELPADKAVELPQDTNITISDPEGEF